MKSLDIERAICYDLNMTNHIEIDGSDGLVTIRVNGSIVAERRTQDEPSGTLTDSDRAWVLAQVAIYAF